MAISPPPGWVKDPNSADWWYDPNGDVNAKATWWQQPPDGFVPDLANPGWFYDPSKDVAHDQSAWWHDNTIIDDPATKALAFWTFDELAAVASVPTKNVEDNWPHICRAAGQWGIAEPLVLIGFLGTMMQETGSLYPVREAYWVWNVDQAAAIRYYQDTSKHAAYQGGWQFHGRGYVQTTHIGGYQLVKDELASIGIDADTVANPDLLLQPEYAAHALCIYFLKHLPGAGMIAACRARDWTTVRRSVYGASDANGVAKLQRADAALLPLAQTRGFA
jgi:predicted chitinase